MCLAITFIKKYVTSIVRYFIIILLDIWGVVSVRRPCKYMGQWRPSSTFNPN